jgi:hypothetical protein
MSERHCWCGCGLTFPARNRGIPRLWATDSCRKAAALYRRELPQYAKVLRVLPKLAKLAKEMA